MRDLSGTYEQYLNEVGSIPQISPEREVELSRIVKGDKNPRHVKRAVNELVRANLRLVVHCANEFSRLVDASGCPLTRADLIGEGNIGLMRAARTFDAFHICANSPRGRKPKQARVRFSTYAYTCIRSHMLRALKRARFVHVPDQHFALWRKMREIKEKHGDELSDEKMAKKLGVSVVGVERLRTSMRSGTRSLEDLCVDDRDGASHWDEVIADERDEGPEGQLSRKDVRRYLLKKLQVLPRRTRKIVAAMFLRPDKTTLSDLAREYGFSRERARQICQRGLAILRRHLTEALAPEDRMALLEAAEQV